MSAPNIKTYLIPEDANSDNDLRNVVGGSEAKLIERSCDGTLVGTQTWEYPFEPEFMIKMIPISEGSNIYEIDVGPGSYHDTNKVNFFADSDFGMACNFVRDSGGGLFTIEDWFYNIKEFAPNSGLSRPIFLEFQVFALRESQYLGLPGSGQSSLSIPFTYIPRFGAYSFNFQEEGFPAGGANYWGQVNPVYQEYSNDLERYDWSGKLNYTIDKDNKRIIFDEDFFRDYLDEGAFDIYIKTYIFRSNNDHSNTLAGIDNTGSTFSGELIYYALPHYDLVETSSPSISTPGFSPTVSPSLINKNGLVEFNNNPLDYPPNGNQVLVGSYTYHTWIRLTNDFTNDMLFNTYYANGISGEKNIEVYNFENNNLASQGHYQNPIESPDQDKQLYVNYLWADIKIINEILDNPSNPPNLIDMFIDFLPRGNLSDNTPENERIERGIGGLINNLRPWDHQEGNTEETDKACFARITDNILNLRNSPNLSGSESYETNPMSVMNAGQAWRIKEWYEDSQFIGERRAFKINFSTDNIMDNQQTGNTIIMEAGDKLFSRIVYILYDGDDESKVSIATAPKRFTCSIKGEFVQ